ncbi:MAG: carbohydrate ABC transporter permease [Bacillota bacterium]|jgi:raffinose/stachyose/melibiose transport system permease protein|uniref:carbohydrate ABC transporter permease n=1 Tax=Bacillaceae TaxID=186817 RepID=UPI0013D23471|nr:MULTISPECIES: sugar ABC transporter permease [Bacillaceae]MBY6050112.1 sugar ABC transporter permease [Cytobacillus firmus]MCC3645963.1 sugar ABC transporter permease [Cytobacillus oceanisediminis]MCS0652563.1 sugar ABC transporter permease [Cytobacillus firmus]MCU1804241.1 sugar ABC transporter permease [Cytobacillus firmus]WHY36146.1 sugar ABC transporter permease [Cytobacillus firmus]
MKKKNSVFLIITIPAFLLFFIFHSFPALQGIFYSFTDWKGYGDWNFVGLKNYLNVFKDERAGDAYLFTFKFAIVATILVNIISLLVAIGLNSKIKFHKTLRAIYFLPYILSILIVGFIFNFIFAHFLPQIGDAFEWEFLTRNILGNPDLAWIGIVIVAVWQAVSFNTILYLAGLVTISEDLYEAASIDGAGVWTKFWKITFPLIAPFFTINMVLSLKNFLMVFDQIVALTGGGPGKSTESISLLIYRGGFEGGEFAYQSANAVIYFIVIIVFSVIQLKFLNKREVEN